MMAVNPEIEPWMQDLANAVQGGLYQLDTEPEETLPHWRHWLPHVSTTRECYGLLVKLADYHGFTVEEAASIIFHRGLALYTDDRRMKFGKLGFDPDPAYDEQSRLVNRAHRRNAQA